MVAIANAAAPDPAVLELRRDIYAKGAVTREDLARLLAVARAPGAAFSDDFGELLAEAAADLLVRQAEPTRYISNADADWLMGELAPGGLPIAAEQRLLVEVLRLSVSVPVQLSAFAVAAFERAIVDGSKSVTASDVEALRVAVFAATDASSLHVTRDSADALFRIARATREGANDPSFAEFFAKAVGDHLLGIAFHWTPRAAEEVQKERWLDAEQPGVGSFLGRMFGAGDRSLDAAAFESPATAEEALTRQENEADASERANAQIIDAAKSAWVVSKLESTNLPTAAERALLGFLGREATAMPQELRALIEREAA